MKPKIPYQVKLMLAFVALTGLLAAVDLARAQTLKQYDYLHPDVQEWQAAPPSGFSLSNTVIGSIFGYFGSFNTNLPVGTPMLSLWAGADTVDNQEMAASMGVEFMPFATSTNAFLSGLSVESVTRNATVAGTVLSEQAGIGWSITHVDTRLTGYIDIGDRFDTKQVYFVPGLRVKKMLTSNTFAGTGIELPDLPDAWRGCITSGTPAPTPYLIAGFNL